MTAHKAQNLLPVRAGESDDERRLREAINRLSGQLLNAVDAAIQFRSAPAEAQRIRHMARGKLVEGAVLAMHALAMTTASSSE